MKRLIYLTFILIIGFCAVLNAQEITVKGKVTSASDGMVLPGVNVLITGTTTGTVTDVDGNYALEVPGTEAELLFSYVGYVSQTIKVGDQTIINVVLEEETKELDEIVVIGYGVQKKKLSTGANLNVKGEDIQALNTTSSIDALKGLSPGVSITQNNGVPGSGNKIFIRGIGTTGNYNPLYIVDGIAVGDIDYLSPSDIESIDVLKDAASAAIYGSRGANGVILVTTKKGQKNTDPIVNYSAYYGWQNVYKGPELLNAQEYSEVLNRANINAGEEEWDFEAAGVPYWDKIESGEWEGTNWFEEIKEKNAPVQSHALNITGGSERSTYSIGASYYDQQGVLGKQANNDYKRINLRLNSEHLLFKTGGHDLLVFGENLTFTNEKNPTIRTGNIYWSDVHNMMVASPFLPMDADSTGDPAYPYHYAIGWNSQEGNPVADMVLHSKYNTNNNNTITGNAYLELQPIKNLKLRSSFGINNWYGSSRHWQFEYNLSDISGNARDQLDQDMYSGYTWTSTNTASYSFKLQNIHSFTLLAGMELIKNARDLKMDGHNENSVFNDYEYAYLDNFNPLDVNNVTWANFGGKDEYGWAMLSYIGRIIYDYKETYLLNLTFRADGSSNFDRGNRWGTFPSVSAGWVVSNEPFVESISDWLNFMKLRFSWGQNGNQDVGRKFVYLSSIDIEGVNYYFGPERTAITVGSTPAQVPNPDVHWETSEQTDIGLDMYFLDNQLQTSFDLYRKDTKDWLIMAPASVMDGTEPPWINGGSVRNSGIEMMLRWNKRAGDLTYGITGTFAYNKNEMIEIPSSDSIIHGPANVLSQGVTEMFRCEVGKPIGFFWGYETDGILQNEEEAAAWVTPDGEPYFDGPRPAYQQHPGDLRFVDQNNDGEINIDDKVMIGNPHPDFIFGLQINVEYKGLYLQLTGNGQAGHQVAKNYRSVDSYRNNFTKEVVDEIWQWNDNNENGVIDDSEVRDGSLPRLFRGAHRNWQYISDIYIYNADYFRISNLTIGYNFNKLIKNLPFEETRLYVASNNLHVFTKYPGMDPEVGYSPTDDTNPDSDFPWGSGIDLGTYPQSRTFMVGLNITF
ncbi:MAG: TonB-dependent receptor [Bacteroidales bacterium]|nr:TonB-dependent receptor [Bacteroidales bacterium]